MSDFAKKQANSRSIPKDISVSFQTIFIHKKRSKSGIQNSLVLNFFFDYFSGPAAKSLQSCPTLCNPMNCNPPSCSVHWILQARILEWVAVPFSRQSSRTMGSNSCLLLALAMI